MKRTKKTDLIT